MHDFSIKLELRIDWSEMDSLGHINNLAILKYIQSARVNYIEAIGLMQPHSEVNKGPILASTNCQFLKTLFYPGQVTIYSKVDYIKNTSFKMQHIIYNDKNEIAAEVQDILVMYDFDKNTKIPVSDEIRSRIETLEKMIPGIKGLN